MHGGGYLLDPWGPPLGPVGATSRIPLLIDLMSPVNLYISCYPDTCYMSVHVMLSSDMLHACTYHVIQFHVTCLYISRYPITCYMHYYCY